MDIQPRYRRHTEAVSLLLAGERPAPKTGPEILELARETEFFDDAVVLTTDEGGRVAFAPSAIHDDPLALALSEGLVLARLTILDNPWRVLHLLEPGVHYIHVDFVEGPDFDEGRWVGRIVDSAGAVACLMPNGEFKRVFSFGEPDDPRERSRSPTIKVHGLAPTDVASSLGATRKDFWLEEWVCVNMPNVAARLPVFCYTLCFPIG